MANRTTTKNANIVKKLAKLPGVAENLLLSFLLGFVVTQSNNSVYQKKPDSNEKVPKINFSFWQVTFWCESLNLLIFELLT